jgi:hypothetical protein
LITLVHYISAKLSNIFSSYSKTSLPSIPK